MIVGVQLNADLDHDCDVDIVDLNHFVSCLSGTFIPANGTLTCRQADFDGDSDVDISDFGLIQRCFSETVLWPIQPAWIERAQLIQPDKPPNRYALCVGQWAYAFYSGNAAQEEDEYETRLRLSKVAWMAILAPGKWGGAGVRGRPWL